MSTRLVSIVTPFYNEAAVVKHFFEAVRAALKDDERVRYEFVCVDDGSNDDTLSQLLACVELDVRFRTLELSRNFGKEAALTAGIEHARGAAVIPLDADLQDPPELIPEMLKLWFAGAEMVLARRADRTSDSILKRVTASLFYRTHNRFSPTRVPENVGDFRLMDRVVVDALARLPERQRFMKGLFSWVGFRTVTIDYVRPSRAAGESKFSGWRLWNLALEGITSFSTVPLRVWTYVGGVCALFTLVYAVFIVIRTLIIGVDVPGYASLVVAILFFGSVQLISIGVLGEYIGRIYMETKQRPPYLIRKIHAAESHES